MHCLRLSVCTLVIAFALGGCSSDPVRATSATQTLARTIDSSQEPQPTPTATPAGTRAVAATPGLSGDEKVACAAADLAVALPALQVAYLGHLAVTLDPGDEALALAKDDVKSATYWSGLAKYLCGLVKAGSWTSQKVRRASYCKQLKQSTFDRISVTSPAVDRALFDSRMLLDQAEQETRAAISDYSDAIDQMEVSLTVLTCGM